MAGVSPKIRLRVENLLRLTSSPNPHEAARAKEEAERVMRKNGLTYADFEKDTIVDVNVPESQCDAVLARVVGISRRCSAMMKRRRQLAFCGKKEAPHRARALYLHFVGEIDGSLEKRAEYHEPGFNVWRRYYWGGFIHSVTARLRDAEVEVWREPPPEFEQGSAVKIGKIEVEPEVDQAEKDLREFAERLGDGNSVHIFIKRAYEAGIDFGRKVAIPDDGAEKRASRMIEAKGGAS